MLVTVNLLAEGLVSGAKLLLCLRDGEWARVGWDLAADADIQEELARMIRMIEDCDIWSLAVFFVVHSECVLLLDLGAQTQYDRILAVCSLTRSWLWIELPSLI